MIQEALGDTVTLTRKNLEGCTGDRDQCKAFLHSTLSESQLQNRKNKPEESRGIRQPGPGKVRVLQLVIRGSYFEEVMKIH